jgi:hypothetical protein
MKMVARRVSALCAQCIKLAARHSIFMAEILRLANGRTIFNQGANSVQIKAS